MKLKLLEMRSFNEKMYITIIACKTCDKERSFKNHACDDDGNCFCKLSTTNMYYGDTCSKNSELCFIYIQGIMHMQNCNLYLLTAIWDLHTAADVTIPALAYLINYLDSQRSGHGRGGPTFFKVGDVFYKICPTHYASFRKRISSETSCGMF